MYNNNTLNYLKNNGEYELILKHSLFSRKSAEENYWANKFHDTSKNSAWYKDQAINPGGWALGYPALFFLFQILDMVHPQTVLELGLGQSTRITAQYAAFYPDIHHIVCEHDHEWVNFSKIADKLPNNSKLQMLELITCNEVLHGEAISYYAYNNFAISMEQHFNEHKIDFVIIDGPFGGSALSRRDILSITHLLNDDFIILLDDTDRVGEQQLLKDLKAKLYAERNNAELTLHERTVYALKACSILATHRYRFAVSQ